MSTSEQDHYYMQRAINLARQAAAEGEVPVGAVVIVDGEVVGEGYNQPITHHDPTAHAEIVAMRNAAANLGNYRLSGATLFVTIEPCSMCAGAMVHARIGELVYGATEPRAGVAESNPGFFEQSHFNHRVEHRGGVMSDACGQLLKDFFRDRRK